MSNYKPYGHSAWTYDGWTTPIRGKAIHLVNRTISTTGTSFHEHTNATNYTVPTGKKFVITGFLLIRATALKMLTITQSDDADTDTNAVILLQFDGLIAPVNYTTQILIPTPSMPEVLAGKYINIKTANVTNSSYVEFLYGMEQDA